MKKLELAKISYKYVNNTLPQRITNLSEHKTNQYDTRNRNSPNIINHTGVKYNKSYLCQALTNWLNIPLNIKNAETPNSFKRKIKKYIIENRG